LQIINSYFSYNKAGQNSSKLSKLKLNQPTIGNESIKSGQGGAISVRSSLNNVKTFFENIEFYRNQAFGN
jgi:hypothetical protein